MDMQKQTGLKMVQSTNWGYVGTRPIAHEREPGSDMSLCGYLCDISSEREVPPGYAAPIPENINCFRCLRIMKARENKYKAKAKEETLV